MKKILIGLLSLTFVLLFLVSCQSKGKTEIDWSDFINFNDITYEGNAYLTEEEINNIKLDEVFETVQKKISDVVFNMSYKVGHGDAAYHEIGTKVYSVLGYDTSFRLAIDTEYGIRLYEAKQNSEAKYGRDILDIEKKVEYISLDDEDAQTELYIITDEKDIKNIVEIVLASPIVKSNGLTSTNRYFLEFHLIDGTSTTRCYWIDDNLMSSIRIDESIRELLDKYINK